MENKKKSKKMKWAIVAVIVVAGIAFATVTTNRILENVVQSGTVEVERINLKLTDSNGNETTEIADWEPGDVDKVSWTVKNKGTAAVYTKNRLQIYWNEDVADTNQVIYLYPANMSKEQILADFRSEEPKYAIEIRNGDVGVGSAGNKKGVEYVFFGDVLDGSKTTGVSKEENYNSEEFDNVSDDNKTKEDTIAFNILFSPNTSYLFQGKTLTVKVITEAMQYTDEGKAEWQIVDTQTIGD